ncbi:AbiJ-NTD4 domain-containing protein [Acinetobacter sp.]|uniref:AbiJ-NTD4 domain-containing protein n=1 Tax=Acinetobacter sp. TaxID=472 RepID=UPI0028AE1648|nr:hypothetical protein [Acinetobacter sp.]
MRFSERYGYKPVREVIQKESMDDALKNSIWNIFKQIIIEQGKFTKHSSWPNIQDYNLYTFFRAYWITFLKNHSMKCQILFPIFKRIYINTFSIN